jgi:alkaline phosphatase D
MMNLERRDALKLLGLSTLGLPAPRLLAAEAPLTRIAFGSCLHQDKPQPIWDAVHAANPELFIFLGDNVYGDSDDPTVLAAQYAKLAAQPGFQRLRANTAVIATWDDHDFGRNDAGHEYPAREDSRQLFLNFWGESEDSLRHTRPDGIYTAQIFGPPGQRVQVILPDLRWNRTPLTTVGSSAELVARDNANMGPYVEDLSPEARMLGEDQWRWLEQEFRKPADVRIFASSIQALANFTGWETWANFPAERERLLALLDKATDSVNLVISGDVHWCEYTQLPRPGLALPHAELTASGLTETWEQISPNRYRVGTAHAVANFGLIEIDWRSNQPVLQLSVRNVESAPLFEHIYPG